MKAKITNTSTARQGIHTPDGLAWIAPGHTRTLTIHPEHVERTQRSKLLEVEPVPAKQPEPELEAGEGETPSMESAAVESEETSPAPARRRRKAAD